MNPLILLGQEGPVVTVTLNRPQVKNALNRALWDRLAEVMTALSADGSVGAVVITGAGDAFASGGDVKEFLTLAESAEAALAYRAAITSALAAIEECPQPVVAAVNGPAIGGGAEIAVACDWRLAAPNAVFAVPAARYGITLAAADAARVASLIGPGRAAEWLLRGRRMGAEEACRLGLVNAVVPAADLLEIARAQAAEAAAGAPLSIRWTKRVLQHWQRDPALADLSPEDRDFPSRSFTTADFREGTQALLQRRSPKFEGR